MTPAASVGTGSFDSFAYDPAGTPWSYTGSAGVAGNGSGFTAGNPDAPEGTQVGFLQGIDGFSQVVAGMPAGTYQLSFAAGQRGNGNAAEQDFAVLVDGIMVATFMPAGTGYETDMTTFAVAAGAHTIDRSVGRSPCARRSDRPKHRRASLRASVSSDRRASCDWQRAHSEPSPRGRSAGGRQPHLGDARAQSILMWAWRTLWQQGRSALDFLSQLLCPSRQTNAPGLAPMNQGANPHISNNHFAGPYLVV